MRRASSLFVVVAVVMAGCGKIDPPLPKGTPAKALPKGTPAKEVAAPAAGFEGMTETELLRELGAPYVQAVYPATQLHAIAKSPPLDDLAEPLAQIVADPSDLDFNVKMLMWQTNHFFWGAFLHDKNGTWVVFNFAEYLDED